MWQLQTQCYKHKEALLADMASCWDTHRLLAGGHASCWHTHMLLGMSVIRHVHRQDPSQKLRRCACRRHDQSMRCFADKRSLSHSAKENFPDNQCGLIQPHSARLSPAASKLQLESPAQQALRHSTGSLKAVLANAARNGPTKAVRNSQTVPEVRYHARCWLAESCLVDALCLLAEVACWKAS